METQGNKGAPEATKTWIPGLGPGRQREGCGKTKKRAGRHCFSCHPRAPFPVTLVLFFLSPSCSFSCHPRESGGPYKSLDPGSSRYARDDGSAIKTTLPQSHSIIESIFTRMRLQSHSHYLLLLHTDIGLDHIRRKYIAAE